MAMIALSMVISKMMIRFDHSGTIGMPEVTSGQERCAAPSR